ncbi:glyoxylate/hydroxypyruvate reductase A [Shimia gijangensis]|uniref:Glyoxylate/hydroxypyruvate reductase A n=1 Tax=Shimia gijangensis TaxID=1470563 RepID=A0A1M6CFL3_9RHOB|nr:glyoxylate/hydroxypyruvate reductase A [Shimia gijangensis]SHI59830.1 glyoxylate/hydroxypyruvate reductase A [Shimia gijangensis]
MDILFVWEGGDTNRWAADLAKHLGDVKFHVYPNVPNKADIDYALVWLPPLGELQTYPNLKGIISIGAGASHILRDPDLPAAVPVVRLVDDVSVQDMWLYACYWVLHYHRHFDLYRIHQVQHTWDRQTVLTPAQRKVSILGLGAIGGQIALKLAGMGFDVAGWSRSPKNLVDVKCFHGSEGLDQVLNRSEILINMLPATNETAGLLDAENLAMLPTGAALINMGRGDVLDNDALIAALDSGRMAGATLDVFNTEPLPLDDPFWNHPKINMTPHAAGPTNQDSAPRQIANDILRLEQGDVPAHSVNVQAGY